jgi:hypothetical protein
MNQPNANRAILLLVFAVAFAAHALGLFFDGLTIAQTQQQLAQAVANHPNRFLQFASNPVYQPLFTSYSREVELLKKIAKVTERGDAEELNQFISRNKLNINPLFKSLLKAKDKPAQDDATRELFHRLARPTVDGTTTKYYESGRRLMSELGIELPELKSS